MQAPEATRREIAAEQVSARDDCARPAHGNRFASPSHPVAIFGFAHIASLADGIAIVHADEQKTARLESRAGRLSIAIARKRGERRAIQLAASVAGIRVTAFGCTRH